MNEKQTLPPPNPVHFARNLPPELAQLCHELIAVDPAARPNAEQVLRRLGVQPDPPELIGATDSIFVGRVRELSALHRALDEARAEQARAVLIHGPSGIGKSALVRRFASLVSEQGDR